jgi:hypothetical protein
MSHLRHLSIGKISAAVRPFLSHARALPKDAWILVATRLIVGLIGSLTTYPAALIVAVIAVVVLILDS